jgi:hypothetical protein
VLSGGLSVPPERIDPTLYVPSTRWRQLGCGCVVLSPLHSPFAGSLAARRRPTTIWSIWPTFSSSVIRDNRSAARERIDCDGSMYGAAALAAGAQAPATATSVAVTAIRLLILLPFEQTLPAPEAYSSAAGWSTAQRPS